MSFPVEAVAASEVLGIEGGITYCSLVYQQLSCHTSIELDSDFNTLTLGVSRVCLWSYTTPAER